MDLRSLLIQAEVKMYHEGIWFSGAVLTGQRLALADASAVSFVSNCWGARFRELIPGLEIVVASRPASRPVPAKSAYNKRGQAYIAQQARLEGAE